MFCIMRKALALAVALNMTGAAIAAENPTIDSAASDYDARLRDLDTRMRNILNTPTDFCDRAAMEAQSRAYTLALLEKFQLQREREKIHPTVKQDMQSVTQTFTDEGKGRMDSPTVDEYGADMRRGDRAAADALVPGMTPWEQARAAEIRHDWPAAFKLLAPLADQGDVKAQIELGSLYTWGTVLVPSTTMLRDDAQALKYLRLAAANGAVLSQRLLAEHYACGIGTERDLVKAYAWFSLAVAQSAVTLATNEDPENILRRRDFIAASMSHDDIQRAKRLIIQCHASGYKDCDP